MWSLWTVFPRLSCIQQHHGENRCNQANFWSRLRLFEFLNCTRRDKSCYTRLRGFSICDDSDAATGRRRRQVQHERHCISYLYCHVRRSWVWTKTQKHWYDYETWPASCSSSVSVWNELRPGCAASEASYVKLLSEPRYSVIAYAP